MAFLKALTIMITIKIKEISPKEAAKILKERNENNYRNLKTSAVKLYEREMEEGKWMFNGDPIRFDDKGNLMDGQTRLKAVVNSGKTQKFVVVEGLNPECAQTMDIGFKRSIEDYLHHFEEMYTRGVSAVVKLSITLARGNTTVGNSQASSRISNTMIVDVFKSDDRHFKEATDFGKDISKQSGKVIKPTIAGAIYYHLAYTLGYDIGKVRQFFDRLSMYSTTDEKSIFKTTYERLRDFDGRSSTIPLYLICWNSFVKGNTKKLISESECSKAFDSPEKKVIKTTIVMAE